MVPFTYETSSTFAVGFLGIHSTTFLFKTDRNLVTIAKLSCAEAYGITQFCVKYANFAQQRMEMRLFWVSVLDQVLELRTHSRGPSIADG